MKRFRYMFALPVVALALFGAAQVPDAVYPKNPGVVVGKEAYEHTHRGSALHSDCPVCSLQIQQSAYNVIAAVISNSRTPRK